MEFMLTHFNRRSDDETGCCKIRALSAQGGGEWGTKHVVVYCDSQGEFTNDPQFLTKVLTGNERWCYGYNPELKQQSSQQKSPNSPRPNNHCEFTQVSRQC